MIEVRDSGLIVAEPALALRAARALHHMVARQRDAGGAPDVELLELANAYRRLGSGSAQVPVVVPQIGQNGGRPSSSMTVEEAHELIGITRRAVRKAVREGRLDGTKDETGAWQLDPVSVENYKPRARNAQ